MFISKKIQRMDLNTGEISYSGPLIAAEYDNPTIVITNGIAYWSDWVDGNHFDGYEII